MSWGVRVLAGLAVASAVFAGVVGAWGAYLLFAAADDLGLNGVLGRTALGASALYTALALLTLLLVRRRTSRH